MCASRIVNLVVSSYVTCCGFRVSAERGGERRGGERIAKYSFLWNMGVVKAHIRYLFSSEYVILLQFNFISLLCYVIRFFFLLFLFITRSLVEDRGNLYILSGTS